MIQNLDIKKIRIALGIFLVIIILLFCAAMFKVIQENDKCTSNPFSYGAKRIISKDPYYCSCRSVGWSFTFDENGIYEDDLKGGVVIIDHGNKSR